jgi:hypothetical protein
MLLATGLRNHDLPLCGKICLIDLFHPFDMVALISLGKDFKVSAVQGREGFVAKEKTEASDEDIDDEYLPPCCRNRRPHSHPV